MADVTPGSATKLNRLSGIATIVSVTEQELTDLAEKVFEKNILLVFPNKKIYITDGVTKLKDLAPMIDQALTAAEKAALEAAFKTGTYVAAEGGVAVLGENAKLDDAQLNVVEDGKIVESYLSEYIEDGKVKLEALPDTVRAGVTYVADIAARDELEDDGEEKKGLVFVIDASADETVDAGSAMYAWTDVPDPDGDEGATKKGWLKISEVESLDINVDDLKPTYEHVEAAGAVMYDHVIALGGLSLTEYDSLVNQAADGDDDEGDTH